MAMGICCTDHATPLYLQRLALISPTSGGRSAGIVLLRTTVMEFSFSFSIAIMISIDIVLPLEF
jgi:hypothetical protein